MTFTTKTLLLLCGLGTAATTLAQRPYIFEDIDQNRNGEISMEEAQIRNDLVENFSRIDSNGNGSLSVDEYSRYENAGQPGPEDVEIPEPGAAPVM